jgi:SAM-dependent methyltransferase
MTSRSGVDSRYWSDGAWLTQTPERLWRLHADAVNREILQQLLPSPTVIPGSVLLKTDLYDEAVGDGQTDWLAKACQFVVGVDLSLAVIEAARKARPGRLCATAADIRRLPFRNGSFNVVVSLSTLDHFVTTENLREALSELARVLRPEGVLLITLDNPTNPLLKLRQALPFALLHRIGLVPYFCGKTMNATELRAALTSAGLEVEELTAILHCPRVLAILLQRALQHFGPGKVWHTYLRILTSFECLAQLPSRFVTGHFIAARCVKRREARQP